eukprot:TRINITY_DN6734_c0_g1_i1.p1 TRINITY_DN6734_c0_g1~~TRINITY_DN6734_c0_g1_i1.p1  ORF type:complete len:1062 (-),score=317.72 TRINITY_DN6734_c0_g1_i1:59-3196(-)
MNLEDLIESVSDAVASLVIFASEAGSSGAVLTNLRTGVTGLKQAISLFTDQAEQTSALWEKAGAIEIANIMHDQTTDMNDAIQGIGDSCAALIRDSDDFDAKENLLSHGKKVIMVMVGMLQMNDLYEVMLTIKQIALVKDFLNNLYGDLFPIQDFKAILEVFIRVLTRRKGSAHDLMVKQMLGESATEISKIKDPLCELIIKAQKDPSSRQRLTLLDSHIRGVLDKAMQATKLSAKSPFDLGILDTGLKTYKFSDEVNAFQNTLGSDLKAIQRAAKGGNANALEAALRAARRNFQDQIALLEKAAANCVDPNRKKELEKMIAKAKNEFAGLADKMGAASLVAMDTGDMSELIPILEDIEQLSVQVLSGSALDELALQAIEMDSLIAELPQVIQAGSLLQAGAVVAELQSRAAKQAKLAELAANLLPEKEKQRILNMADELLDITQKIQDILDDPNGNKNDIPELVKRFRKINAKLTKALQQSLPQELINNAAQLDSSLNRYADILSNAGSPEEISSALGYAIDLVKPELEAAEILLAQLSDDDPNKESLQKAIANFKDAAAQLVLKTKEYMAETDPVKKKKLLAEVKDAIATLQEANANLVAATSSHPEVSANMMKNEIETARNILAAAIKRGDLKAAAAAIAQLKKATAGQVFMARIMANQIDDPELRARLLNSCNDLSDNLLSILTSATKDAIANKDSMEDPMAGVDEILSRFTKDTNDMFTYLKHGLDDEELPPEKQMECKVDDMKKSITDTLEALKSGDKQKIGESLVQVKSALTSIIPMAKLLADGCDQDGLVKKMLEAIDLLSDQFKNFVLTTKSELKGEKVDTAVQAAELETALLKVLELAEFISSGDLYEDSSEEPIEIPEIAMPEDVFIAVEPPSNSIADVFIAARDISELTFNMNEDEGTPEGRLIRCSNQVAGLLTELSVLATSGSRKEIIEKSQNISKKIAELNSIASAIGVECPDHLLAQELKDFGQVAKNFAIQLKILGAVQANNLLQGDDGASQSLVKCAKGLSTNIQEIINLSQIAVIKTPRSARISYR